MNNLFTELKRRNIFRVIGVYAVVGWLLIQMGIALETSLDMPSWFDKLVTTLVLIGFPVAMVLAWAFEMTPDGVKPTLKVADGESVTDKTGKTLNGVLVGLLAVALGVIGWQTFGSSKADPQQTVQTQSHEDESVSKAETSDDAKQSIAVLPFEDFTQDKSEDYFARGISEELLNVLARIDGLRVASRTSAFAFKDEGKSVSEIAEALDVAHVLEGSIRKSGTTLRITAQLIDTSNDEHLWSDTYDRPLTAENLFQIQDEISAAIVMALKGQLTIKPPEASGRTVSLEAYETYLKAREDHNKRLPEPLKAAEAGFKKVIALDPNFAPAYSGLADTYLLSDDFAGMDNQESLRLAEINVRRALELAPNSAEALSSAAMLETSKQDDYDKALDYAARAIAANPNYSVAYHRQGNAFIGKGQFTLALEAFQKGLILDPASEVLQSNVAYTQNGLGDFDGARASAEALIRSHPNSPQGYSSLARFLGQTEDYENMHRLLKDAQALNSEDLDIQGQLSWFYAIIGLFDQAPSAPGSPLIEVIIPVVARDKALALTKAKSLTTSFDLFYVHYFLGDQAEAYTSARNFIRTPETITAGHVRNTTDYVSYIAETYARAGDPNAADIIKKLDDYFQDRGPAEFTRLQDLEAGARLQFIKGNPKTALPWVERMMDLGLMNVVLDLAPYDVLRDDPEFTALLARNTETRARIRKAIEAQLANPPEVWWSPDELEAK